MMIKNTFSSFPEARWSFCFCIFFLLCANIDTLSGSYNTLQSASFFAELNSSITTFFPLINGIPDYTYPFIGLNFSKLLTATCSSSGFCDYFNVNPDVEFDLAALNWTTIDSSNGTSASFNQTQFVKTFLDLPHYNSNITWTGETSKAGISKYVTSYGDLSLPNGTMFFSLEMMNGGLPGTTLIVEISVIFNPSILGQKQYLGNTDLLSNNYRSIEFGFPFGLNVTFGSVSSATVNGNPGVPANIQYRLTDIVVRIGIELGSVIKLNPITFQMVGVYNATGLTTASPITSPLVSTPPSVAPIVVPVVLVFVVLVIAGAVFLFWYYRKSKREKYEFDDDNSPTEKFLNGIEIEEMVGGGNFGQVQKGKWKGNLVALKTWKGNDPKAKEDFEKEAAQLQKLRHPAIVTFYGLFKTEKELYMVTEFIEGLDLLRYLRTKESIPYRHLLQYLADTASAMVYLQSKKLIHRDLACRNLLFEEASETVKITDFGLSRSIDPNEGFIIDRTDAKPVRWCSPEVLTLHKYSFKSDVFAFSIVMWECLTCGLMPYTKLSNRELIDKIPNGERPSKPECVVTHGLHKIYELMSACWEQEAEKRPAWEEVQRQLTVIQKTKDDAELEIVSEFQASKVNQSNN